MNNRRRQRRGFRRLPRGRGYALPIVLLVLMLLAASVTSLATLLDATIAEGRKTTSTIRAELACGSSLDLAARTVTKALTQDPSLGPAELLARLCTLGTGTGTCAVDASGTTLPHFLAPPGTKMEQFRIAYSSARSRTTRTIPAGPFKDRVAVEQALSIFVGLRDTITQRPCIAIDRYVVPSLPLTSFPLFATAPRTRWKPELSVRRVNDGAASLAHLNGNTGGSQISPADFNYPGPQFAGDLDPVDLVRSTRGVDQVLAPSVGTPTMSPQQAPLSRSLRWLVEPPGPGDSEALAAARLAAVADVVIVDGVWYSHRDKSQPWPGTPIWSDHGGANVSHLAPAAALVNTALIGQGDLGIAPGEVPRLYSWYDRADPNAVIDPASGVLSYGPLAVTTPTSVSSCSTDADCSASHECLRLTAAAGTCQRVEPGVWPSAGICGGGVDLKAVSTCVVTERSDAVVDGARGGFRDADRNIWPINLDIGVLGEAMASVDKNELGPRLGGPLVFNGVIYVTSRFTGSSPPEPVQLAASVGPPVTCMLPVAAAVAAGPCPSGAPTAAQLPRSSNTVPVGLCGPKPSPDFDPVACDSARLGRPNALRVYNAGRVPSGVFPRGLTIATDLPLYVYGDVNRVQTGSLAHVKVALVADRVTFLSRAWRDGDHPWYANPPPHTPAGQMMVEASIISGLPLKGSSTHDVGDLFRTPQRFSDNHFLLRGHLIAGFNSELDDRDDNDDRVNGGLRWLPDYHLDNPGFQPPGMPLLTLPPTARWRQRP